MKPSYIHFTSCMLVLVHSLIVSSSPIQFEEEKSPRANPHALHQQQEEGRIFHAHAMRKRKKKKLLQCLLNLQRSNPREEGRFLFLNYFNLEYTQHGGGHGGYNDESSGGGNNCLNQHGGGSNGGDHDDGGSDLGGIGEGINNLGSLVSQVGQMPVDLISSVGDGIKPVFENSERYINRYIIRPLYRSLRPLYKLF